MDLIEVGAGDLGHRSQSWQATADLSTVPAWSLDDASSEQDHGANVRRLGNPHGSGGMERPPTNRDAPGARGRPDEESRPSGGRDVDPDEGTDDPLAFETVIVPARLRAAVARRVAIASNRDGVSIADLLGRAAAAYYWQVPDDAAPDSHGDR
jgi:hypothetical protein